jgi:hypothetical protein
MVQCGSVAPGVQDFDNHSLRRLTIARYGIHRGRQPAPFPPLSYSPLPRLQAFQ